ncbi:hypothetical protein FKP32DRAFT_1688936 [Trametes sanguinea]|nr:hypothetical protein FKP32DRAFT_1688936 [Trametes sanguinea]
MTTLLAPIAEQNVGPIPGVDADVEPDAQWKEALRSRIERGLQSMVDKVRQERDSGLRGLREGTREYDGVMKTYQLAMDRVRRIAEDQFNQELKIARFERSLALGKEIEGEEFEAFRRQQQAIWDKIKKDGAERPQGRQDPTVVGRSTHENGDPVAAPPRATSGEQDPREGPSTPYRESRPPVRVPGPAEYRPRDRTQSGGSEQVPGTPGSYGGSRPPRSRGNSSVLAADFEGPPPGPSPYDQGSIGRQGLSSLSRTRPQDIWLPPQAPKEPPSSATSRTFAHATAPNLSPVSPNVVNDPHGRSVSRAGSMRSNERPSPVTDMEPGSSLPRDSRPIPRPPSTDDNPRRHSPSGPWHGSQSPPDAFPFAGYDLPFATTSTPSPRHRYANSPAGSLSGRRNSNGSRSVRSRSSRQEFWGPADVSQRPLQTFEEQSVASDSDSEDYGMDLDDLWHVRERQELTWKLVKEQEAKARRKEEEAERVREEARRREEEARRLREEARLKEEKAEREREEARRQAEEAKRQAEAAQRQAEEAKRKEEEAKRKEKEVQMQQLEVQKKMEELHAREAELLRREMESKLEEERRKRQEAENKLQEEIRRRQEAEEEARRKEEAEAKRREREEADRREREAAERRRRQQEEADRLRREKEEADRRQRERKEREEWDRKERERREREEKERRDREEQEWRERREREEKERRDREARERDLWERGSRDREERERRAKEEQERERRMQEEQERARQLKEEQEKARQAKEEQERQRREEEQMERERQEKEEARRRQQAAEAEEARRKAREETERLEAEAALAAELEARAQAQEAARAAEAEALAQARAEGLRRDPRPSNPRPPPQPEPDLTEELQNPELIRQQAAIYEHIQAMNRDAKIRAEEAARRRADEEARRIAIEEAKRASEEEARAKRLAEDEAEARRLQEQEEANVRREREARRRAEEERKKREEHERRREEGLLASVLRQSAEEAKREQEERKKQESVGSSSSYPRPSPVYPSNAPSASRSIPIPSVSAGDRMSAASSSSYSSSASFFSATSGRSSATNHSNASTPRAPATPTPSTPIPTTPSAAPTVKGGWKSSSSLPRSPATPIPPTPSRSTTGSSYHTAFGSPAPHTPSMASHSRSTTSTAIPHKTEEDFHRFQTEQARIQFEKFEREQLAQQRRAGDQANRQLTKEEVIKLFQDHERRWNVLAEATQLAWESFPWPMLKAPSQPEDLTYAAVQAYVLSPHHPVDKAPKDRVKDYLRRWHPDRFETKLLPKVLPAAREKVKEGAGTVARHLNKILSSLSDSAENGLFG